MNNIKVTVLMAVYNGENYIRSTIESILSQSYKDFDFLIIDDCSKDATREIIKSYNDPRIHLHLNASNRGQTPSLNDGLRLTQSSYIARIDADDVAHPDWLEKQLKAIEENPQMAVVSCSAVVVNEKMQVIKIYRPPQSRDDIILRSFLACPINHVGSIMNRQVIIDIGGYDESYRIAEDYELWARLLINNYAISSTPEPKMTIRVREDSFSRIGGGKVGMDESIQIIKKLVAYYVAEKIFDERIELFCRAFYDEMSLDEHSFKTAIEVLKQIYSCIKPEANIDSKRIYFWQRKYLKTLHLKRVYRLILTQNYLEVRKTSCQGMAECGRGSSFTIFFLSSFFGGLFLNVVPKIYSQLTSLKARSQAKDKKAIFRFRKLLTGSDPESVKLQKNFSKSAEAKN